MTRAKKLLFEYQQQAAPNHTVLSYLQNSGSAWLNTGIKGRSGLKVELKVMFPNTPYISFFFGSRTGTSTACFDFVTTSSAIRSDYGNLTTATSATINTNTQYTIKKFDNRQYLNDVEFGSYAALAFNNNLDMYLYACNTNGAPRVDGLVFRTYGLKVWDENDVLLGNFIPVIKDSVYCAYNEVTGTYHYNQGTGSFTGG